MKTKLEKRLSALLLIALIINVVYFVSSLMGYLIFSTVLAFPVVYIVPGLMILLLASKKQNHNFRQLIILSFFLSTIIGVIIVSTLILLGITISVSSISMIYLLLTVALVFLMAILGRTYQIRASRLDYALLSISLITYTCFVYLFTSIPRLLTMDETTYITWVRYAILKGEIYPIGVSTTKFDLLYLVNGRFFWVLLITSFLGSTGLPAYQAYTIGSMFLPMIAIASTLLIASKFRGNKLLEVGTFTLTLFNPALILFSGFILNDLVISFYLLLSILFFTKSFNQSDQGKISISIRGLLISFLTLIVASLIKENIIIALVMYIILVICVIKHRLYKVSKAWKALLYALTLPLIAYEVLIDIPYVVSVWFVKNETIAMLTSRFLFISPAELFLGMFIPTAWDPTTIFSYDLYGYLNYLYRMLSPETLSLLIASVVIALPLALTLEGLRKDMQTRLLICLSSITFWLTYLLYLSQGAFEDIPRYFLFMVPVFTMVSLITLYEVFSNRNITFGLAIFLFSIFLFWVQSILSIEKGGVYLGYGLPKLNWTGSIIFAQFLIYVALMVALSSRLATTFKVKIMFKNRVVLDFPRVLFATLIVVSMLCNAYFSVYYMDKSVFFKEHGLRDLQEVLDNKMLANNFVFSNIYFYARPYIPDSILLHDALFSLPRTEDEFVQLLKVLPNNTLLLLGENQYIAWHEYANRDGYIFKYAKSSKIIAGLKNERRIYDGVRLHLSFDEFEDVIEKQSIIIHGNVTLTRGIYGNALSFNGVNVYVEISTNEALDNPSAFTVEAFVKPNTLPQTYQMIVSKGWNYAGGWKIGVTPDGKWEFAVKNQNGDFYYVQGGVVLPNNWYHIIGVWDGSHLWLYVNGFRYGPVSTTGVISNDYRILVGQCELLGAGNYWNGAIDDICIYDKALTEKEILDMYFGPELFAEKGNLRLFRINSQTVLNLFNQSSGVNVKSINIERTNSTNVRLEITIDSLRNSTVIMYLDTLRFLKTFNFSITSGKNLFALDFPYRLPNRDKYGIYIMNWANIAIVDSQGNLIYHELHTPFALKSTNIAWWISFMLLLLTLLAVLIGRKGYDDAKIKLD